MGTSSQSEADFAPPFAGALIESLRAFGYELPTALADLADNSIYAGARKIELIFHWAGEGSMIAISDNGLGMTESTLVNAMRVGSKSPTEVRDLRDLGRFGLGLKTASFSQCRRVTVFTRTAKGKDTIRCWDIDHIVETDEWRLLKTASEDAALLKEKYLRGKSGTLVVWEKIDRLTHGSSIYNDKDEDAFLREAESVSSHFALVFHRLMSGKNSVQFRLNNLEITPWDPFLADEAATQILPEETLKLHGEHIHVRPYVLPHLSRLDQEKHKAAAGVRGWNAHQGFYVYRNQRLLVDGSWLGIRNWRQEEHYKLARILVDLPNSTDMDWGIDVTKSRANAPPPLRSELARIGERTRSVAKRVYSHRGEKLIKSANAERTFMWEQVSRHNRVRYKINREHPLLKEAKKKTEDSAIFDALLRLIEETVPIPLITITDRENPDRASAPFESSPQKELYGVLRKVMQSLRSQGLSREESILRLQHMDPFQYFPELLERLEEEQAI